ncbi:hypothetical protein CEP54_000316 [Fusarium duplospermum]|uniref:Uncharacterized protein n=1 Tax=Fusarium duplospermum TaxID=1325734 RepID=A0A428R722_9HYPO|nr:hypothetical protein CEP54_000316 [Fusarium duplospermum]
MGGFQASSAYKNYLGKTVISRPEDWLLPRLDLDQNNQIYMAPGEVYCRFRDADGHLCSNDGRFSQRRYLIMHYRKEHDLTVACNATNPSSVKGRALVAGWYKELIEGLQPSWRAKDQRAEDAKAADRDLPGH